MSTIIGTSNSNGVWNCEIDAWDWNCAECRGDYAGQHKCMDEVFRDLGIATEWPTDLTNVVGSFLYADLAIKTSDTLEEKRRIEAETYQNKRYMVNRENVKDLDNEILYHYDPLIRMEIIKEDEQHAQGWWATWVRQDTDPSTGNMDAWTRDRMEQQEKASALADKEVEEMLEDAQIAHVMDEDDVAMYATTNDYMQQHADQHMEVEVVVRANLVEPDQAEIETEDEALDAEEPKEGTRFNPINLD